MNCRKIEPLIFDFADGSCDSRVGRQVEAHVAGCKECSVKLDHARRILATVRAIPPLVAPEGFRARVGERIAARESLKPSWRSFLYARLSWRPVAALGVTAALAIVLALVARSPDVTTDIALSPPAPIVRAAQTAHEEFVLDSVVKTHGPAPSLAEVGAM